MKAGKRKKKPPLGRVYRVGERVLLQYDRYWLKGTISRVRKYAQGVRYGVDLDAHEIATAPQGWASNVAPAKLRPLVTPPAPDCEEPLPDEGAGDWFVSEESVNRGAQVAVSLHKLLAWNVAAKLPHRKQSVADAKLFVDRWADGDRDTSQLSSLAAILRGLEAEAREFDQKEKVLQPFPLTNWDSFDIENAKLGNLVAKPIGEAAAALSDAAKDAAKEANQIIAKVPSAIPTWVYVGGGVLVGLFAVSQVAQISNAAAVIGDKR